MNTEPTPPASSKNLSNQSVLITGATGGIGRAVAMELATAGAKLVIHGNRNLQRLDVLLQDLKNRNVDAQKIVADLSDARQRHRMTEETFRFMEDWNVAVFAAGLDLMSAEIKQKNFTEKFDLLMQVDVAGAIEPARNFAETLVGNNRTGTIILFGWDGVEHGMAGETATLYTLAKGALHAATRSLAKTYAPHVRLLCVAPGWIKTTWGENAPEYIDKCVQEESLSGRWGTAEEVARLVRFLISDDAAYINGQIITINGGRGK